MLTRADLDIEADIESLVDAVASAELKAVSDGGEEMLEEPLWDNEARADKEISAECVDDFEGIVVLEADELGVACAESAGLFDAVALLLDELEAEADKESRVDLEAERVGADVSEGWLEGVSVELLLDESVAQEELDASADAAGDIELTGVAEWDKEAQDDTVAFNDSLGEREKIGLRVSIAEREDVGDILSEPVEDVDLDSRRVLIPVVDCVEYSDFVGRSEKD
jgi:hypothetical protein